MNDYNDFYGDNYEQTDDLALIESEEWGNFQVTDGDLVLNLDGEQDEWQALSQALEL